MKKFLITTVIIISGAAGYFFYEFWFKKESLQLWSVIPAKASLVYESNNIIETWSQLQDVVGWKNLSSINSFPEITKGIHFIDSLVGSSDKFNKLVSQNQVLISLHIISKDAFDFLFTLEARNIESHSIISEAIEQLKDSGLTSSSRTYQGHSLSELRDGKDIFTFIFYKNYFIGSFTPFLVEDVIRTIDSGGSASFSAAHQKLYSLVKLENDAGNLYINSAEIGSFINIFSNQLSKGTDFNDIALSTFLDLAISDNGLSFSGFTLDANADSFLGTFNNNPASVVSISSLVPLRTAIMYHLTASNQQAWQASVRKYWLNNQMELINQQDSIKLQYDIDIASFSQWMGPEKAVAILESAEFMTPDMLVFVETTNPDEALKQMNRYAEALSKVSLDTVYIETYDEITIHQLNENEFPRMLLGEIANGFNDSFYLIYGNYLVISNNIGTLKRWYDDVLAENTWGKSIRVNRFLESTLQEANLSIYLNTIRSWDLIKSRLSPKWAAFVEQNSAPLKRFEMGAIQYSYIDNKYYTNVALHLPESPSTNVPSGFQSISSVEFPFPLTSKPHIVRNHNDRNFEALVQDTENNLYLLSQNSKVLWHNSIGVQITSDVHQVDFYKNNKLQYLFATENMLHLIDRNGDYVPPFPISLKPDLKVLHFSVIDYDGSKNYRFMVATHQGDIYLYDKDGNNLDGWSPRNLDKPTVFPGSHIRIRTRDRLLAIQKNGIINLFARNGDMAKGFPIDLKGSTESPVYLKIGSNFDNSNLTTITTGGEIVSVSLGGKILRREQLYKPSKETQFFMLPDAQDQSYLFIRKDNNQLSVLDMKGQVIFEKNYLSSDNLQWQYYNFGGGKEIIIIIDKDQEFTYLYNRSGNLINYQPLESSFPMGLLYFARTDKMRLYKTFGSEFSILEFEYR
ncbi:MAG: DUF3352 domain-containing protein [Bacteroidetes bacterium]|nr:DUF3352 domain-containing protein [Bacteroidota bacterium]MDA1122104.1 DUF3352 domain-containing protein [Bacteroidota bacterium]